MTILTLVTLAYISRQEGVKDPLPSHEMREAHIEQSWVVAETKEVFLEVKQVLGDPRTTFNPIVDGEDFLESGSHDIETTWDTIVDREEFLRYHSQDTQ